MIAVLIGCADRPQGTPTERATALVKAKNLSEYPVMGLDSVYGYKDVGGIVGQLQNKSLGHAVARECINYSKKTSAVYTISGIKTAGAIAGQLGSPSDKVYRGGTVWNCYYK